jgi:hypothetical protein
MSPYCKSAAEALADSPLAGLVEQARVLSRVSSAVSDVLRAAGPAGVALPPLHCALKDRTVIITVHSAPQAAKLRQRTVALQQALLQRVPEVTGIRIRLQLGESADLDAVRAAPAAADKPSPPQSREYLSSALRFADDLARDLHDSPLRRSAQRLQASLRAKLKHAG